MVSAVASGVVGCGGSSARKPNNGTAGHGGAAGGSAGGTAGASGDNGTAGATAGAGGMAGSGGMAGAGGGTAGAGGMSGAGGMAGTAGGTAGAGGTAPVLSYCEMHTDQNRALPYNIANDFKVIHVLSNNNSAGYWKVIGTPDCSDNPTYPPFTTTTSDGGPDAGADAGSGGDVDAGATDAATDAAVDGGDDAQTLALVDPDAGDDGGVADAAPDAPEDAPADVPATDASATDGGSDVVATSDAGDDAGSSLPACYEFSYDPDGCTGTCWAGVVFEVTDVQGPDPTTKGVCIAPGAINVEFWARSSKNNARVKFGSIGEGTNSTEFYENITTTWARYTVAIPGTYSQGNYNTTSGNMQGVWNAFSVVVEQTDYAGGAYIEVKDIHWISTP
jgi:hypothetical protein